MFTISHLIWIIICITIITIALIYLNKHKPSLKNFLTISCVICFISEMIKFFSTIQLVPSSDGSMYYPFIEQQHLPLHLCSLQILLIFYARFAKDSERKEMLLAFMYPTCIVGAILAIAMPSIFNESIHISQAFTHPLAYQFFLYHTMLIILGIYIAISKQVNIKAKHYFSTIAILGGIAFISLYVNSSLASTTYINGELISVDYTPNFFFTYNLPMRIPYTEIWHWYLYMIVIALLAIIIIGLFYLPYFKHNKGSA